MTEHAEGSLGVLETEKDAGKGSKGKLNFWLLELAAADKLEKDFRKEGESIEDRYRAEDADDVISHNILYSNVETMRPALYDSSPKPDIRRRFRDQDPVGKQVAELLERAASHQVEVNDFDAIMENTILDMLLPGRGVARVGYLPTFQTIPEQRIPFDPSTFNGFTGQPEIPDGVEIDDNGQMFQVTPQRESIKDEKAKISYVPWRNFRMSPARIWEEVRWVSFDWYLTKSQLKKMFPEFADKVPLDTQTKESYQKDQDSSDVPSVFKRAYVREIWNKKNKEVIFIAPSYKEGILHEEDDPLGLEGFFPNPRPMYSVNSSTSMVPVPEFFQYKSQAEELDEITKRIRALISALRLRGAYDATLTEIDSINGLKDNEYIPIENANQWRDSGGLEKAFFTMPIVEAANVLKQLYAQREQIKDTIFEITGLSDILRGVSNANETATAQNIKSQFGSLRINRRQREVQRFARDLIRIIVEIAGEHFQPETLQKITQKQITPEMMQIIKSDQMRSYRVDIETDSTIAKQIQDEEENFTKLLHSIGQFIQNVAPMVVQGFIPLDVAVSLLKSGIRRFKMGRSVEDAFESIDVEQAKQQIAQQAQQGQKDPEAEAKQQEMQLKTEEVKQKLQLELQKLQLKQQEQQSDVQFEQQRIQLEREKAGAELQLKRDVAGGEMELKSDIENKKVEASKSPPVNLQLGTEGAIDETFGRIIEAMVQITKSNSESNQQMAQLMAQSTQQIATAVSELSKPKRIIRKNGQIIGAEPVDDI